MYAILCISCISAALYFLTNPVITQEVQSKKRLPDGKNEIRPILTEDFIYVDKTGFALKILRRVRNDRNFFIARPSGFGKTLFVDTLEAIFKGEKELFRGTEIRRSKYRWIEYPVLRFDFRSLSSADHAIFLRKLGAEFRNLWKVNQLPVPDDESTPAQLLEGLIVNLSKKFGRNVVVLVDEYDFPLGESGHNRSSVIQFFLCLKRVRSYIHFTFVTGVHVFSPVFMSKKVRDLTADPDFAGIMGYTEDEFRDNFSTYVEQHDGHRGKSTHDVYEGLRRQCYGYRFSSEPCWVYNPQSVLKYLRNETSASIELPELIVQEAFRKPVAFRFLAKGQISAKVQELTRPLALNYSDLTRGLAYQSGLLTINKYRSKSNTCSLAFPSDGVREAFGRKLASRFSSADVPNDERRGRVVRIALVRLDFGAVVEELDRYFKNSPYEWLPNDKKFYQMYAFSFFNSCCLNLKRWGDTVSVGMLGFWFAFCGKTFMMRLEVDGSLEKTLAQVEKDRNELTLNGERRKVICAVAMNFDSKAREHRWKAIVFSKSGERIDSVSETTVVFSDSN